MYLVHPALLSADEIIRRLDAGDSTLCFGRYTAALALYTELLNGNGACRVHGGGFAGTVQAYVPLEMLSLVRGEICRVFGENAFHIVHIRRIGASALW